MKWKKLEVFIIERINKMKKKLNFKKILLIIFFYILGIIFMIMIILYILAYILIKPVIS